MHSEFKTILLQRYIKCKYFLSTTTSSYIFFSSYKIPILNWLNPLNVLWLKCMNLPGSGYIEFERVFKGNWIKNNVIYWHKLVVFTIYSFICFNPFLLTSTFVLFKIIVHVIKYICCTTPVKYYSFYLFALCHAFEWSWFIKKMIFVNLKNTINKWKKSIHELWYMYSDWLGKLCANCIYYYLPPWHISIFIRHPGSHWFHFVLVVKTEKEQQSEIF